MPEIYQSSEWYTGIKPKQLGTGMKERSLEQLMAQEPDPVATAERAFTRVQEMQEFIFRVDVGDYPLTHFSSGETKKSKKYDKEHKQWVVTEEPVAITIFKDPKSKERGLRDLAARVIFTERTFLKDEGCGDIADRIIATGSMRDAGSYIGNKK